MPGVSAFSRAALVAAALCVSAVALAHNPEQTIQETYVYVRGETLTIEYRTTLGGLTARTRLMAADRDSDGRLSLDERQAFLTEFAGQVLGNLSARIDGEAAALSYAQGSLADSSLSARTARATISLRFESKLGFTEGSRRALALHDANFPGPALGHIDYYVNAGPSTHRLALSDGGRGLEWGFTQTAGDAREGGHAVAAEADAAEEEGRGGLAGFIARDDLSLPFMVFAVLMAALLGAGHALSPGHSKAMVAAYMVGSKGRVRDAVFLGGVVTFTHVFGMVVLGVIALLSAKHFAPENIYGWLGAVSGSLVFLIGFWMLARKALGHDCAHSHSHPHPHPHDHDHSHNHGHDHDEHAHGHSHAPERAGAWGLLSLGVAGGMVPCPTTLVVLLTAVALHRVGFGIALMIAYSLGLATTLIVIGVVAAVAGAYLERREESSAFHRYLPVVSSLVIMLAGIGIAFSALGLGGMFGLLH